MAEPNLILEESASHSDGRKDFKRRIEALKKLHVKYNECCIDYHKKLQALDHKYAALYEPIFERRKLIISSEIELTDAESQFLVAENSLEKIVAAQQLAGKGIPGFWLTIFKKAKFYALSIEEWDEPILQYLDDVKVRYPIDPMSFILEFHFASNEFFTNSVLSKEYFFKCAMDEQNPFLFNGPEYLGCRGCEIFWKDGKNVTIKQKNLRSNTIPGHTFRIQTLTQPSFFNFFSPAHKITLEEQRDEAKIDKMDYDYYDGMLFSGFIVEQAVLYYTGDLIFEETQGDESEDSEDSEDKSQSEESNSDTSLV